MTMETPVLNWPVKIKLNAILLRRQGRLNQIPLVSVKVFKHGYRSIDLFARILDKADTFSLHRFEIAPEVIGVKKQKNSAARLIADSGQLSTTDGFGQ